MDQTALEVNQMPSQVCSAAGVNNSDSCGNDWTACIYLQGLSGVHIRLCWVSSNAAKNKKSRHEILYKMLLFAQT